MFNWCEQIYIRQAAQLLREGGIVAYPTEAVWGLGANPFNGTAIDRLLSLKQRSIDKGLIVVAANIAQLAPYLSTLSAKQKQLLAASWPGPVTWLVPNDNGFPYWISGQHNSVAMRVSAHPVVQGLCLAFGGPIVSTSANPQGKSAPRFSWQVHRYFKHNIDYYTPGQTSGRKSASEIRDLLSGQIVRQG